MFNWLKKKAPPPAPPVVEKQFVEHVIKIPHINGELTPGFISVEIAAYTQMGNYIPGHRRTLEVKIHPNARASVNRVLAGLNSVEDKSVLSLMVFDHPECIFKDLL